MKWPVNIELIRVPVLFPRGTLARVSNNRIYWLDSYPLTPPLVAHECRHVHDRYRLGWRFLFAYLWGWVAAGFSYRRNRFEVWAHEAESDPYYLAWAEDVIAAH